MAVLSLVYIGMVTRALGLADFGRFALITGTAQTLATLVSFETWKVVVQYGLEHEGAGRREAVWRLEQAAAFVELMSAGVGIGLVAALFLLWPRPFGMDPALVPYAFGYVVVQLITLRSTPTGILRMRDRFRLAALADSVQPVGRLIGACLAQALMPTLAGFLSAWALAEVSRCWRHGRWPPRPAMSARCWRPVVRCAKCALKIRACCAFWPVPMASRRWGWPPGRPRSCWWAGLPGPQRRAPSVWLRNWPMPCPSCRSW
jgi:hypothetical protein